MRILLCILSLISIASLVPIEDSDYVTKYQNYQVYRVVPKNEIQIETLKKLAQTLDLDFWTEIRGLDRNVDIMVGPHMKEFFLKEIKTAEITYTLNINDVSELIKNQKVSDGGKVDLEDFDYGIYHSLGEIYEWINQIAQAYPQYVSVFNLTKSYEGRALTAFKISIPSSSGKKPAIWLDSLIHAREWVTGSTLMYMANSLLSLYGKDANITAILNTFDFYILPVFNVDGYVYTWTIDRNWRKTRSRSKISSCIGVDPNRNWDDHWCEQGASTDPCDDSYCGPKPFSEPEVKAVSDFLAKNNDSIVCYINFHSYSQLWMSPYGWTTDKPANFTLQDNGSAAAVNALYSLYQTPYVHGTIADVVYIASGSSADWTYDKLNIFFSYGVELRDQGQYGFFLPENQLIPSGKETLEAIKALAIYIKSQI